MSVNTICISMVLLIGIWSWGSVSAQTDTHKQVLESIVENDFKSFRRILDRGYNVNSLDAVEYWDWLMCEVTQRDRIKFLKYAIKSGGDINTIKPKISQTHSAPLMCAIYYGNKEAFDYLLAQGANPNIVVCPECELKFRYLPFREALVGDHYEMAHELLAVTVVTEQELEDIRFMLEDNRYLPNPEESEEEYRLKFADYMESKGFELNIWTPEKENSGEWLPPFLREEK